MFNRTIFLPLLICLRLLAVPTPQEGALRTALTGWGDQGTITLDHELRGESPFGVHIRWQDNPKTGGAFWHLGMPVRLAEGEDRIRLRIYLVERSEKAGLALYFTESDGDRWIVFNTVGDLAPGMWQTIDVPFTQLKLWPLGDKVRELDTVGSLNIEPAGKEQVLDFVLADARICGPGGERDLFDPRYLPKAYSVPADAGRSEPLALDATSHAVVAFSSGYLTEEPRAHTLETLAGRYPDLGVSASGFGSLDTMRELVTRCRALGAPLMSEGAVNAGFSPEISLAQAWAVRWDGQSNNLTPGGFNQMHTGDTCHPFLLDVNKRRVDALLAAGITKLTLVDYVWPYWGGRWGYSEAAKLAFRAALDGTDGGILLRLDGQEVRYSFWDYFTLYADAPWSPEQVGIASWSEYVPVSEKEAWGDDPAARRNMFLFITLYHYRWLKFLDDLGGYLTERSGELWIIPNPEDLANGSDYVVLGKMARVRGFLPEYFGNPLWTEAAHRSGAYLASSYHTAGNLLGPIFETNAGGHGTPYYDPEVAYVATYDICAALHADTIKNDFLDESTIETMTDPAETGQHGRYVDTAMKLLAFQRYRQEQPTRVASPVAVLTQRNVNRYRSSLFFSTRGTPRTNDTCLATRLAEEGALFDFLDPMPFAPVEDHDVIFWGAEEAPEREVQRIARWLAAKPDRTLICQGNQPTRRVQGLLYNPWDLPQDAVVLPTGGNAWGLPLIGRESLAAIRLDTASPWFASEFRVGEEIALPPSGYYSAPGGEVLLGTKDHPLVSRFAGPGGSTVIYLHYRAGNEETAGLDRRLVRCLMAALHVPRTAGTGDTIVHSYQMPGGTVAALWHRPTLAAWKFVYDGNRKQRLAYQTEGAELTAEFPAVGPLRATDLLTGEQIDIPAGQPAKVRFAGRTCALVYLQNPATPPPSPLRDGKLLP